LRLGMTWQEAEKLVRENRVGLVVQSNADFPRDLAHLGIRRDCLSRSV
jgi:hypothetical protein